MRNAFADEIEQLAAEDPRIVLLSGDIGNRLFDKFKARFPDRFYNCGVAEANMITMAAGLAMTGLRPVVYTIASFLIYRPYEQIRIDIGYHNLPVTLVGVGGGLSYASNGVTHHSTEDIAVMRAIPTFQIFSAGDTWEVRAGLSAAVRSNKPTYLRIGKKNEPIVHSGPLKEHTFGRLLPISDGGDCALIACGTILPIVAETCIKLSADGLQSGFYSMPSIVPLDEDRLAALLNKNIPLFIIEEHSTQGGLGTTIIEWGQAHGHDISHVTKIGCVPKFVTETTTQFHAREKLNLTADYIYKTVKESIQRRTMHDNTNL